MMVQSFERTTSKGKELLDDCDEFYGPVIVSQCSETAFGSHRAA
jgi:uncharacterized membrane protein YphA (DoxX/SURF4 family)